MRAMVRVQRRQRLAESATFVTRADRVQIDPFEGQPGMALVAAQRAHLRHAEGAGRPQQGEAVGFGSEHAGLRRRAHLDEERASVGIEPECAPGASGREFVHALQGATDDFGDGACQLVGRHPLCPQLSASRALADESRPARTCSRTS
jgi:hypothetical protein